MAVAYRYTRVLHNCMTSPPSDCALKLGDTDVSGTLLAISADGGMCIMTAPASQELDLSQLGARFLSPGAKVAISEAWSSRTADSQTAEAWKEAVREADVDLTEAESADLFRACSSGCFGDLPELPAWAVELVSDADESPVPPTWVFASDDCVAFLARPPAYGDEDADDTEEPGSYTFISKNITPVDMSIGMAITLPVMTHDHATVAVIHRFQDGSCVVIEDGAFGDDHYKIAAEDTEDLCASEVGGVVVAYSCYAATYAAALIKNSRGEFWIPVALLRTSQASAELGDASGSDDANAKDTPAFGQIGGDFYVNKDNKKMHIATALKILQRWVDQVSTNRAERFRVRNKKDESDLVPLAFYAVKLNVVSQVPVFVVATLDKLVRVAEGSATTYLDTASYSAPNVDTQFTLYDLREDGTYARSIRQTNQEPHMAANSRIIARVDLSFADAPGVNGGTLSDTSKAVLLGKSFVDERQAAAVSGVSLQVRKKGRAVGTATTKAPPLTAQCALAADLGDARAGDVLLKVDGRRVTGATAGRSALRSAINREQANGGCVDLTFWRPPVGWTPPASVQEEEENSEGPVDSEGASAVARGEFQEVEMVNLARVTKRLEGGDSTSNLTRFCKALGVPSSGSVLNKKRRIETELRRLKFADNTDWAPTHGDIASLFAGGTGAFHAKFAEVVHTVASADRMLRGLLLSSSA